ncbi:MULTISPECIES: MCE family protein [Mumia]|uniref:MCE family protein n=1 Tax=Mumia TaxID=1546255 RepID=UPI0014216B63|nr:MULTISPECIES: MCE family protein [unclassified Mumia]QMW67350.1 MCE family protein [Mumia sp. ZJ1417]
MRSTRLLDSLLGVGYFLLIAAFVTAAMLVYNKAFVSSTDVRLTTGTIGNALQKGSDVKLNGVPVGTVTSVEAAEEGATLTLALEPEIADELPPDTVARLLPKTLFGERYVALQAPEESLGGALSSGDTIRQDTSDEAIELEEVFDELLPLLQSIQPEKLSATLGELAAFLRGRGTEIGDSMSSWAGYMDKMNPLVPQMAEDFGKLGELAVEYEEALPDLINALDTMTTTSKTLTEQRTELGEVYANVIAAGDETTGWVKDNKKTIIVLSEESRVALKATAPYASQFPCLLRATSAFVPQMDDVLGAGTDEPGIHVVLNVVESRGKYLPGKDRPRYRSNGKPRCPYMNGQTGTTPVRAADEPPAIPAPPSSRLEQQFADGGGLGEANSPGENQLIAELVAPTQGLAPAEYPSWSSLLVGPTLRHTKVTLK